MPGYKTHLLFGAITYFILAQILLIQKMQIDFFTQGLFFCLFGSLFPDIDIKSKGQKYSYIGIFFILIISFLFHKLNLLVTISLIACLPHIVKHRGIFHEFWFLSLISICIIFIVGKYNLQNTSLSLSNAIFFLSGASSHILSDKLKTKFKKKLQKNF